MVEFDFKIRQPFQNIARHQNIDDTLSSTFLKLRQLGHFKNISLNYKLEWL